MERVGSNPSFRAKRTEQFRCRGLNAYGINCFRAFHPLKFLKPNDRCQRAILSDWRDLNPDQTCQNRCTAMDKMASAMIVLLIM